MNTWDPEFLRNLVDISEFSDVPFAGLSEQLEPSNGNSGQDSSHLDVISQHFDQKLDMTEQSERNETNTLFSLENENKNYNRDTIPSLSFAEQGKQMKLSSAHYDQTEEPERNENKSFSDKTCETENRNCESDTLQSPPSSEKIGNQIKWKSNGNNGQDPSHLDVISEHFDQNLDMTEQSERNESNPLFSFGDENKNYICDSVPSLPFSEQGKQMELSSAHYDQIEEPERNENKSFWNKTFETEDRNCESDTLQSPPSSDKISNQMKWKSNGNNGQDPSHFDQNLDMTEQPKRNESNPLFSFGNENKNYNCDSIPSLPFAGQGKQMKLSSVHYDQTEKLERNENKSFSDKTCEAEDRNCESDTLQSLPSSEKIGNQIIETLKAIQNDAGATLLQIKKYLSSNRNVDVASMDNDLKEFIRSAVSDGVLVKTDRFKYFLASEGVPQKKTRKRKHAQAITYPKRRRN